MSDSNEYYDRLANAELERRQAAVDAARADERARIVAWLRSRVLWKNATELADMIEAGDE